MKKMNFAIILLCVCNLSVSGQDSTWKSTNKQKRMEYKNKKDSMNMWPSSDSTMKKNKMWKKGMKDSSRNNSMDTLLPMQKHDTLK